MSDRTSIQQYAERPEGASAGPKAGVTRLISAPRQDVWKAWTDPERLKHWWGPRGFTSPMARTDARVGGRYLWGMRSPEGQDFYSTGVFREVVEPERLVLTDSFADAEGNVVPAAQYGMPGDWPDESVMTVTFDERDGGTVVTVRSEGIPEEMREPSKAGMRESLDKLAEYLETGTVQATAAPDPRLRRLDPYVGTWSLQGKEAREYGEIHGTLRFEWMEGGYFLMQHVDINHAGQPIKGIEVIGYGRDWDGTAPEHCTSHFFDNTGNHFVYIYEVGEDGAVTIWGGEVGSPAAFRGRFSEDKKSITGRWDWPGGGYDAIITRTG